MLDERALLATGQRRSVAVRRALLLRRHALLATVAVAVFWLGFDGGTYSLRGRGIVAIVVWWAISLGMVLRVWDVARVSAAARLTALPLLGLTVLTALSGIWGSAELAVDEMSRTLLYLGVFTLVVLVATTVAADGWLDGLALAVVGVSVVALASRFLPDVVAGDAQLGRLLPSTLARLSYPLDYWNGLGILAGLGVPLLLSTATGAGRSVPARAVAVASLPILGETIYLTSSRGAAVVALLGAAVVLAASARRFEHLGALLAGAAGAAIAVAVLSRWTTLVNHPQSHAAVGEGHAAALVTVGVCIGTGLVFAFALGRVRAPQLSARARRILAVVAALAIVGGLVAVDPIARFDSFRRPPDVVGQAVADPRSANPVQAHLLSSGSTGRWQQWTTALHEFDAHPFLGGGAGSFEAWWAQHGSLPGYIKDAHSLYFETLGELGVIGFLLVGAFLAGGLAIGVGGLRAAAGPQRETQAALLGVFAAYCFGAGIDWMWEMPAVTIVGVAALALLVARAARRPEAVDQAVPDAVRARMRKRLAAVLVAAGTVAIAAEAVPLLGQIRIDNSQAAVRQGNLDTAAADAQAARRIEPWAASPYTQLALIEEQRHDYGQAILWMDGAIARSSDDWRLWLTRARLQVENGNVPAGRRDLDHAKALNPRSLLFAGR